MGCYNRPWCVVVLVQNFLKLADGQGWVFTHDSRKGHVLVEPFEERPQSVIVALNQGEGTDGQPRITANSLSGEEKASIKGHLASVDFDQARNEIADQMGVKPALLKMLHPAGKMI